MSNLQSTRLWRGCRPSRWRHFIIYWLASAWLVLGFQGLDPVRRNSIESSSPSRHTTLTPSLSSGQSHSRPFASNTCIKGARASHQCHYKFSSPFERPLCKYAPENSRGQLSHSCPVAAAQFRNSQRLCSMSVSPDDPHHRDSSSELTNPDEDFKNELYRIRSEIRKYNASEMYRQYSNLVPLTVNILRQQYGERASWWGDLTTRQTRILYQRLLPRVILSEDEYKGLPLKDRAYIASMARYAAKLYTRERSTLPGRLMANVYDGLRYALATGRLSWTGMSVDEIWQKYEDELNAEMNREGHEDEYVLYRRLYERIISKSCTTNALIDQIALGPGYELDHDDDDDHDDTSLPDNQGPTSPHQLG